MHISIDETGSFREGRDLEYGVITLVSVTDKEWNKFNEFMNNLFPSGWENIKGKDLNIIQREKIIKYIGKKHEIKYLSFLYDMKFAKDEYIQDHKKGQIDKIKNSIDEVKSKGGARSLVEQLELMSRRIERMSIPDFSKFILIYDLLREWQQYFQFDFVYVDKKNDSWEFEFIIDRQSRAGNFKELLVQMQILTMNHLNPDYQIYSPPEFQASNHPFEKKYGTVYEGKSAIDGKRLFRNIRISDEQEDPVLFLPDFIGNTIHQSFKFRKQKRYLMLLKRISRNRSLVMNNRFRKGRDNYYLVRGFRKDRTDFRPSELVLEHHKLMMRLQK